MMPQKGTDLAYQDKVTELVPSTYNDPIIHLQNTTGTDKKRHTTFVLFHLYVVDG